MSNLTKAERKQVIVFLKALHAQNFDFLASVEKGTTKKKYKQSTIDKFKKRNDELAEYIKQIELGGDYTRTIHDWCVMFGDILIGGDL